MTLSAKRERPTIGRCVSVRIAALRHATIRRRILPFREQIFASEYAQEILAEEGMNLEGICAHGWIRKDRFLILVPPLGADESKERFQPLCRRPRIAKNDVH